MEDIVLTTFGENIRLCRLRRKIKSVDLSVATGIARTTLYQIEKGNPSVSLINYYKVLKYFNCHFDLLNVAAEDFEGVFIKNKSLLSENTTEEDFKIIYTYLMLDGKYVKIGKSKNPRFREATLQAQKPSIELYATTKSNIETYLHKLFDKNRVRGEWFELSNEEIMSIIQDFKFKKVNYE